MDRGAWRATAHAIAESWTRLTAEHAHTVATQEVKALSEGAVMKQELRNLWRLLLKKPFRKVDVISEQRWRV